MQLLAQSLPTQLQTEKVHFKQNSDTKCPGQPGHTDAWWDSCVFMCARVCVRLILETLQVPAHEFVKTKQRGVTLREMTGNEQGTWPNFSRCHWSSYNTWADASNFQSHTQVTSVLAFTWLLKHLTL